MGYEYDIFISYRRSSTAGEWVKNHMLPRLEARLDDIADRKIRISCDLQIEGGTLWPADLKRRLKNSSILLAVLSADYFRSDWCMAEWQSFKDRETLLNAFTEENPSGLVYPIRYADGKNYHPSAQVTQCKRDFSRLNYPDLAFRESAKYLEFDDRVCEAAEDILRMLESVPAWSADFPISEPGAMAPAKIVNPTL